MDSKSLLGVGRGNLYGTVLKSYIS
jgi:hypothetical protein